MVRPGICSVTFRQLTAQQVVSTTAQAGLECVEWGADGHVPPGDAATAAEVRRLTEEHGLAVASYGSYLRFEGTDDEVEQQGAALLESAVALSAPRIRVWAGGAGSREITEVQRTATATRIHRFADAAAEHGIEIGLEFHGNTLTDEIGSTLRLLEQIDHPGVRTYWQPHQGMPTPDALDTLRRALPHVSTVHVFSWWPVAERLPLAERSDLWAEAFSILQVEGAEHDALLEFVPGDEPEVLAQEAEALRHLITAGGDAR